MIIPIPQDSGFGVDNLPYGVFNAGGTDRIGVAVGDHILDVGAIGESLGGEVSRALDAPRLNEFLSLGRSAWRETRDALTEYVLSDADPGPLLHRQSSVSMRLPFMPGDYVDFYSSEEHATNLGRMFRPDGEPLLPNWRHLPVGYHGRSSSVVVSGTPIQRPHGQRKPNDGPPVFGPTAALDIELEVGFVTGPGNEFGSPIEIDDVGDHIFGLVLVNDWSARDIQRWEYVPLGPFLGKSFATSVSPWVVTMDALAPYMVPGPRQDPEPLPYLVGSGDWGVDIQLEIALSSADMRARDIPELTIANTSFAGMYWTMAQQLAHATSNGTNVRPGDLYASGTVSGPVPGSYGSLIELTWRGEQPIELPDGTERRFLEDGDQVILRGTCAREGAPTIGFGSCSGTVVG